MNKNEYAEAVTEARILIKRSEDDQWALFELTHEVCCGQGHTRHTSACGVSFTKWGDDINVSRVQAARYYAVWMKYGPVEPAVRPTASEAMASIRDTAAEEEQRAVAVVKRMKPSKQAEVFTSLAEDADAVMVNIMDPEAVAKFIEVAQGNVNVQEVQRTRRAARREEAAGDKIEELSKLFKDDALVDEIACTEIKLRNRLGEVPDWMAKYSTANFDEEGNWGMLMLDVLAEHRDTLNAAFDMAISGVSDI